jgi:hypothetical protein
MDSTDSITKTIMKCAKAVQLRKELGDQLPCHKGDLQNILLKGPEGHIRECDNIYRPGRTYPHTSSIWGILESCDSGIQLAEFKEYLRRIFYG